MRHVVYVGSVCSTILPNFSLLNADVHLFRRPQIVGLIAKEAPTKVFAEYLDFADVFSLDLVSKLLKYSKINDYTIELGNRQQPSYEPIYSPGLIKLETLKAYIEINLANGFIRLFKSPANTLI